MKILTQDRSKIINFPKTIYVKNRNNCFEVCFGNSVVIGRYSTEARAKAILAEMLKSVANNQKVFVTPEE